MINNYSATIPAGVDQRDVAAAAVASLPSPPKGLWFTPSTSKIWVGYDVTSLSGAQVTAFQNAVAAATNDPNAPWRLAITRDQRLADSISTLRTWANTARSTTATSGNQVAVLNGILANLGTFYDNMADLLQSLGKG